VVIPLTTESGGTMSLRYKLLLLILPLGLAGCSDPFQVVQDEFASLAEPSLTFVSTPSLINASSQSFSFNITLPPGVKEKSVMCQMDADA